MCYWHDNKVGYFLQHTFQDTTDILNLVIPNVEEAIQTQIADLVRQSDRLRQESQALLEEAKRKVEQAIKGKL